MKMTKRFLAGLFALTMCVGMAACGSDSGDDGKESSVNAKEIAQEDKDKLSEAAQNALDTTELKNKTIKFLSHWDINPSDGGVVGADLQMFKDTYDGKIEYIQTTWENRYVDLAKAVMANDSPDFFSAMDMDGFPKGAIKAMFEPIDDYVDLNSELWAPAKATCDAFVFNGGHYVAGIQSYPQYVCVYNTKTIEENGLDDPAELYWNDEWTWSKFTEMCTEFTNQEEEKVGLDGWWYAAALNDTCGVPLIGLKDGKLVNNMDDPKVAKVQELMYNLGKNEVFFDRASNNWSIRGDGTTGLGVGTYQTLFYPVGLWGIEGTPESVSAFGDVEAGEIMFVPMPRMDDSDTYWVTSRVDGYLLCKNAPNPEGFAAFMNCRMLTLSAADEIGRKQHIEDYKWNDDMMKMRDEVIKLCNDHPLYDFQEGVSEELKSTMENVRQATVLTGGGATTWTQCVEENKAKVDYLIKEANENIQSEPTAE